MPNELATPKNHMALTLAVAIFVVYGAAIRSAHAKTDCANYVKAIPSCQAAGGIDELIKRGSEFFYTHTALDDANPQRDVLVCKAQEYIDCALSLQPDSIKAKVWAGIIAASIPDYQKALRYLTEVLKYPQDPAVSSRITLLNLNLEKVQQHFTRLQILVYDTRDRGRVESSTRQPLQFGLLDGKISINGNTHNLPMKGFSLPYEGGFADISISVKGYKPKPENPGEHFNLNTPTCVQTKSVDATVKCSMISYSERVYLDPLPLSPQKTPFYKRAWFWVTIGGAAAAVLAVGFGAGLGPDRSQIVAVPL